MPKFIAELYEIGTVRDVRGDVSVIEIHDEFQEGLLGIGEKEKIVVLFWIPLNRDRLKVHPRGDLSKPMRGVFSTRSPVRPNNIGVTEVRLLKREGNLLFVKGLDALKGTSIVDVKSAWCSKDGSC
ncbi:MAG: tRNA (N6-threonylcarbamoyladenosine(37)-N6)-methyltransferase TrmO [Candidatus Methanofastidiosia archaeon]